MRGIDVRSLLGWALVWLALPALTLLYAAGLLAIFELVKRHTGVMSELPELTALLLVGFAAACQTLRHRRRTCSVP